MKKTLIALSVLALMTACSSADEDRMDAMNEKLIAVEATNAETTDALLEASMTEIEMDELERRTSAMNTFFNPQSVFSKSGIEIIEENGVVSLIMPNAVVFDLNSYEVKPEFEELLDTLAEALIEYPKGIIKVSGHTDTTGTHEYNKVLSEKRAESVKAYLVGKEVEEGRIETEGLGETKPRYSNETTEGRMKNRRIEVDLFKK